MLEMGEKRRFPLSRFRFWWIVPSTICVGIASLYWLTERPFSDSGVTFISVNKPLQRTMSDRYSGVWSPYADVLSEEEAFRGPVIKDSNKYVQGINAHFRHGKVEYGVGDNIYINIEAYDLNFDVRSFGGDHIRLRMTDKKHDAYSSGYVLDHGNGKYTGVLKALWSGTVTILVELHYTREEITYLYGLRRKAPSIKGFKAHYGDGLREETSYCQPFPMDFETQIGVCNFTHLNADMPWFCPAPVTVGFTCKHLLYFINSPVDETIIAKMIKSRSWNISTISHQMQLHVQDGSLSIVNPRKPKCPKYDRRKLWQQRSPIGYFYNGTWILQNCVPARDARDTKCVSGKTIILYGDSTVQQWYDELTDRFNCTHDPNLHRSCWNLDIDLSIHLYRHNLPGNPEPNNTYIPLVDLVNLVPKASQPVFLLHIYTHYAALHHSVYRQRIKRLRKTIEQILAQRPDALILFKGPHTFSDKLRVVNDYYAFVYRPILIEEFKGIDNKVVYLDFKDMSISKNAICRGVHPVPSFVSTMVDEMMAYVC